MHAQATQAGGPGKLVRLQENDESQDRTLLMTSVGVEAQRHACSPLMGWHFMDPSKDDNLLSMSATLCNLSTHDAATLPGCWPQMDIRTRRLPKPMLDLPSLQWTTLFWGR